MVQQGGIGESEEREVPDLEDREPCPAWELEGKLREGRQSGKLNVREQGQLLLRLAKACWGEGKPGAAVLHLQQAAALWESINELLALGKCWHMMGQCRYRAQEVSQALDCFKRAYAVAERSSLDDLTVRSLYSSALCKLVMNEPEGARNLLQEASDRLGHGLR
ncbi:unnamed protein product, partial [Chrysoparadoxa australica]